MNKVAMPLIALLFAFTAHAFTGNGNERMSTCGYYYWFRVQFNEADNCNLAQYFLEYPVDRGDGFPEEVFYGDNIFASIYFGCFDGSTYCCALGYNASDIELVWPGTWKPKPLAFPQCIVYKD